MSNEIKPFYGEFENNLLFSYAGYNVECCEINDSLYVLQKGIEVAPTDYNYVSSLSESIFDAREHYLNACNKLTETLSFHSRNQLAVFIYSKNVQATKAFKPLNKEDKNLSSENIGYDKKVKSIRDEYSSGEMLAGLMTNFAEGLCEIQKKAIEEARENDAPKVIRHYKSYIEKYDTVSVVEGLFTSSASMPVLFDTFISILKNKSSEYIVGLQGSAGVGKNVVIEQAIIDVVKDYGQAYIGVYNCDQSTTQMNLTEYINPLTDSISIGILYEAIIKANELYKNGDDTPVILLLNELTRMRGDNLAQALSFFSASDTVITINGVNYKRTPNLRVFFNGNTDKGSDVSNLINTDTAWGRRMQSYDLTGILYADPFVEGRVCYDALDKVRHCIADGTIKDISSERLENAVKIAQDALDNWDGGRFPAEAKISLGQLKHDTDRDKDKEIFANVK